MPKILTVHRTQAVWEVETLMVTVPDDIDPKDYQEFVEEYLDSPDCTANDPDPTITGNVENFDTTIEIVDMATLPQGEPT